MTRAANSSRLAMKALWYSFGEKPLVFRSSVKEPYFLVNLDRLSVFWRRRRNIGITTVALASKMIEAIEIIELTH